MGNKQSMFCTLPEYGLAYLDTSTLSFSNNQKDIPLINYLNKKISIVSIFNEVIEKRKGDISTAPSILKEIRTSIKYYKNLTPWTSGVGRSKREGYTTKEINTIFSIAKKGREEFEKLCSMLEEKIGQHSLPERFNTREEEDFVNNYNDNRGDYRKIGLSNPDKDLVVACLKSGGDCGIVSADSYLLQTYAAGIKKFRLEGCFTHNPFYDKTNFLQIGL